MKTEKEIKKVERKKGRVNGQITQIMTSFRVDADVVDYLKSKPNRGRFLNELIRGDMLNNKMRKIMEKSFEINGMVFKVKPYISDSNCYRLQYEDINIIDDTACEDFYGDIDDVAEVMKSYIIDDAMKDYPWWKLIGARFYYQDEVFDIELESEARKMSEILSDCENVRLVTAQSGPYFRVVKSYLNYDSYEGNVFRVFNYEGTWFFCLKEDY